MNRDFQNDELFHYGVLGMRWGVRRYQNIDGSLTERGKDHREAYVKREQRRLNKLYDRESRRYDRKIAKAEKRGDKERADYLRKRKADAETTRKSTNDYISKMTWDQIKEDEAADREDLKKIAKTAGAVGLGAAGIAAGGGVAAAVASGTITAPMVQQKIYEVSQTQAFKEGKNWVDLGITGYVGARGYVMGASVNAVLNNIDTNRINQIGNDLGNSVGNAASNAARQISRANVNTGDLLGQTGAKVVNDAINSYSRNVNLPAYTGPSVSDSVNRSLNNVLGPGLDPKYVGYAQQGAQYYQQAQSYYNQYQQGRR